MLQSGHDFQGQGQMTFFKVKAESFSKIAKNSNFQIKKKSNTQHTLW